MPSQSSLTSLPPQTSCGHQSATILRWINNADTSSPSTWTSSSRKRSHSAQNSDAEDSPISSRTRKRKRRSPLGEISANAMPEHDKIAPREGNRRSPRKHSPSKKVSSAPSTPSGRATVLGQALDDFDDDDDTPRAQGAFSLTPSDFTALPPPSYDRVPIDVEEEEESDSDPFPERSSTPSRSPTHSSAQSRNHLKVFVDLEKAQIPTEYSSLDGEVAEGLKGFLSQYRRLQEISSGGNIIPQILKHMIEKKLHKDDQPFSWAYTSSFFEPSDKTAEYYWQDAGKEVFSILKAALRCEKRRLQEVDWNTKVHEPLLNLAVSNPKYCDGLESVNVTSARIAPVKLLAKLSDGTLLQGKKVDLCIALNPSDRMMKSIKAQLEYSTDYDSINQTPMASIRRNPIAISAETKRPFCGDESSDIQLSVWTAAGIERLLDMKTDKKINKMPVFPAVSIHGHDVHLTVFERQEDRNVMYGRILIGGTNTIRGIFQIIAMWEVLADWANGEYRQWFESYIS